MARLHLVFPADERVQRVIHRGLRQVAAELTQQGAFLGARGGDFLRLRADQLLPDAGKAQAALTQYLGCEAFLFAQQAEQQVLGADVPVGQPLGFFGGVCQNPLALVAQGKVHGSGNFLPDGGMPLDLFADGFNGGVRAQKPVGQRLVLAQQAQQQVLGLDVRAAELARFVAGKEYYAPGFFRVPFEHVPFSGAPAVPGPAVRSDRFGK